MPGRIARTVLSISPVPLSEQPLSEADIDRYSGKFESAEGTAIPFGDQGRIRVKFDESGASMPLLYLGDSAFDAGPDRAARFYLKNGRTQGAAIYTEGLFMDATWRVASH